MLADCGCSAIIKHDNLVRIHYGADPLSDDKNSGIARLAPKRPAQIRIRLEVEGREAVIEQVDIRLANERPCNGEPLLLAAGYVSAALRDNGIEAILHLGYEFTRLRNSCRMLNLFIRSVLFAITDIVGNRTREQAGLLRNETDLSAKLLLRELADIDTANADSASATS